MGLSLEGFGGEFEIGKIALIGRFKKRKRRRKEIGEFSFWGKI